MYLVSMVILVAYSAALISFLTVQRKVLPFETLEELLHDGTYNLQVLPGVEMSYFHVSYKSYHNLNDSKSHSVFLNMILKIILFTKIM
jgi:hypothetical protein